MAKILCLAAMAVFVFQPASQAQNSPVAVPARKVMQVQGRDDSGESLTGNYQLKLAVFEKDQPLAELMLVTATAGFRAEMPDPLVGFMGTIKPESDGTVLVSYQLNTQVAFPTQTVSSSSQPASTVTNIEYKSSSAQASVILRLGEPIQIWKSGSRTYQLSISLLGEASKKSSP